jgi:hypothetical protein
MTLDLWHPDDAPLGPLDPAYDNAGAIPGARDYPPRAGGGAVRPKEVVDLPLAVAVAPVEIGPAGGGQLAPAAAFRSELAAAGRADLDRRYGDGERQVYDLFRPMRAWGHRV